MPRRPQPRHITLGGREAVALPLEEYEQLIASRRQIGGQSARVRVLAQEAKRTEQLLRDLESLIAVPGDGGTAVELSPQGCTAACSTGGAAERENTDCLRCAIAALLRRHRDSAT
ncbi:hypothetical protein [Streptomyces griseorubiginosus]|uniref:hypothetical protein n=1 Tax=Streptomyces griseorubiginosus TaxID=67304 RepID=UPI0033F1A55E